MAEPVRHRGVRIAGGVVLIGLAIVLAFVILTNDDRDRGGAAIVALMAVGGVKLLRSGAPG